MSYYLFGLTVEVFQRHFMISFAPRGGDQVNKWETAGSNAGIIAILENLTVSAHIAELYRLSPSGKPKRLSPLAGGSVGY